MKSKSLYEYEIHANQNQIPAFSNQNPSNKWMLNLIMTKTTNKFNNKIKNKLKIEFKIKFKIEFKK